jgi:hypothetical protein
MEFELKGGVLIIGSLFWQNQRDKKDKNLRKLWREECLNMSLVSDVEVPIRYMRFSKDKCYTMVFDNTIKPENFGIAKAIKLKKSPFLNFNEIKSEVKKLSNIEGRFCDNFIKGQKDASVAWCVCSILFNPKTISTEQKEHILNEWVAEFKKNEVGYNKFILSPELYSLKKTGELDIPWPKELGDLDFLIATSTMPLKRDGIEEITPLEIANYLTNRDYFYPNIENGIKTYQDDEILEIDKKRQGKS